MTLARDLPRPPRKSLSRAVTALLLANVGLVITFIAFSVATNAALSGSDSFPAIFIGLLVVGLICSAVALVLALIGIIVGQRRVLSLVALLIALVPGAGVLTLVLTVGA